MRKTLIMCLVASLSLLFPLMAVAAQGVRVGVGTRNPQRINLPVGKSTIIDSQSVIKRVSLAAPDIADTIVLSPRQIYVVGKAVGSTNLTLWGDRGRLLDVIDIEVAPDLSGLKEKLHQIMPGEDIQVTATQDTINLSGNVSSTIKLTQALSMAEAFAQEKVINLL